MTGETIQSGDTVIQDTGWSSTTTTTDIETGVEKVSI